MTDQGYIPIVAVEVPLQLVCPFGDHPLYGRAVVGNNTGKSRLATRGKKKNTLLAQANIMGSFL